MQAGYTTRRLNSTVLAALLAVLLLGCAGGGGDTAQSASRLPQITAEDFELRVLPSSFAIGGRAGVTHSVRHEADSLVVEVRADGADRLKALHIELDYDPARLSPLTAEATGALATDLPETPEPAADPLRDPHGLLQLGIVHLPGTVYHSQVLIYYDDRPGFSGDAALAEVRFALRPFEASAPAPGARETSQLTAIDPQVAMMVHGQRTPLAWDTVSGKLRIHYGLPGDYNQNGEVAADDITPLALHFSKGVTGSPHSAAGVCDGDSNGEVNAADIARIGSNFGRSCVGYELYVQDEFGLPYPRHGHDPIGLEPTLSVQLSALQGDRATERLYFEVDMPDLLGRVVWARPRDNTGSLHAATQMCVGRSGLPSSQQPPVLYTPHHELSYEADQLRLNWRGLSTADNDNNGYVNSGDIIPIAANFGQVATPGSPNLRGESFIDAQVDGWDVVPVGLLLNTVYDGYQVYMTADPEAVPQDPYAAELLEPIATSYQAEWIEQNRWFHADLELPAGAYVWVRPYVYVDGIQKIGTRSEVYQVP